MEFSHKSVLLQEVIDHLNVRPDGIYADGTLGGAGHAYEVCRRLGAGGRLIGIDQDEDAIAAATERLSEFQDRVTIVRSNYEAMKEVLAELGIEKVNGITLDLGVSSYQLDAAERGFSYREDAPLDMRMDNRQEITAATIVNEYTESELYQVIRKYGEDKFAKNIAKHIVQERQKDPVLTTGRLAQIVDQSIPMKFKKKGGHPAKRTFQAIRIEVNRELTVLEDHISEMIDLLAPGGRFCIITFHSLEDRIVKNAFRTAQDPCTCPPDFPVCVCGKKSKGKVLTRKPVLPSERELEENSRSKSAKLRVFEHI
ncbi:MAG: 16S rRNA (cytosine(1402)-N(4))-methyltransferase RsmH [Lachnospiraceae bacterium]|nr:16S rRNA (cytosine(1402)-N(4))-methyltransferase RsmH [Lachnospiraceae bacterium]